MFIFVLLKKLLLITWLLNIQLKHSHIHISPMYNVHINMIGTNNYNLSIVNYIENKFFVEVKFVREIQ